MALLKTLPVANNWKRSEGDATYCECHACDITLNTGVSTHLEMRTVLCCSGVQIRSFVYYNSHYSIYTYVGSYVLYINVLYVHYWPVAKHACSVYIAPTSGHMPITDWWVRLRVRQRP